MKKLKLIVSDFHIGKGRMLEDGTLNTLEDFIYDDKFIDFLEYYSSRDYRSAEVELILNGDFLNTLQVDYRDKYPAEITEHMDVEKVRQIFEGHPELFDAMRDFAAAPHHSITYIAGNHDPALHWQAVREMIDERLSTQVTYPSFSYAFESILMEDVDVGRYAKLRRVIVDKGVRIPPKTQIGYDPEEDAKRFVTTPSGIVVIPKGYEF